MIVQHQILRTIAIHFLLVHLGGGAEVRIYAYKVTAHENSGSVEDVLRAIHASNLEDRVRLINQTEIRAEEISRHRNGLWLLDFVRMRFDHGPGKVHRRRPIEGFHFRSDEGFGEETAALYDPATGYMLVEYNHFGVRAGKIESYLSQFRQNHADTFELHPKLDPETERKMQLKTIFRRLGFTIANRHMNQGDQVAGIPLTRAVEMGNELGADRVTVVLSAERANRRGLSVQTLQAAIGWLRRAHNVDEDAVERIEVAGKDNDDEATEIIDLIAQRLSIRFDDLRIGADRRYPRDQRWHALERAHLGWQAALRE